METSFFALEAFSPEVNFILRCIVNQNNLQAGISCEVQDTFNTTAYLFGVVLSKDIDREGRKVNIVKIRRQLACGAVELPVDFYTGQNNQMRSAWIIFYNIPSLLNLTFEQICAVILTPSA